MADLSGPQLGVMAGIAAWAVWSVYRCFASAVDNAVYLHDLRVRVNQLRKAQLERLQQLANHNALDGETRAQLLGYAMSVSDGQGKLAEEAA